jgi:hypothetical protein
MCILCKKSKRMGAKMQTQMIVHVHSFSYNSPLPMDKRINSKLLNRRLQRHQQLIHRLSIHPVHLQFKEKASVINFPIIHLSQIKPFLYFYYIINMI